MYEDESGVMVPDDAGQEAGVTSPDAGGAEEAVDETANFEADIKGKYKDPFNKRVEGIVTGRLKTLKARNVGLEKLANAMANRYGTDPNDIEAILRAAESDNTYIQAQADENGVTPEVQAQLNEYASFKRQREFNSIKEQMAQSVQETQEMFPEFDLDAEMQNPQFMGLIGAGVSVKDAYKSVHLDEIIGGAIQYAVGETQRRTLNDIQARGSRPLENGASSRAAASAKVDVNELTPAQMDEYERRAERGEIITFT